MAGQIGRQAHRAVLEDFQRRPVEAEVAQRGVARGLEWRDADIGHRQMARHLGIGQPPGEDDPPPEIAPAAHALDQCRCAPRHRRSAAPRGSGGRAGVFAAHRAAISTPCQWRKLPEKATTCASPGGGRPSAARVAATSAGSRRAGSKRSALAPHGSSTIVPGRASAPTVVASGVTIRSAARACQRAQRRSGRPAARSRRSLREPGRIVDRRVDLQDTRQAVPSGVDDPRPGQVVVTLHHRVGPETRGEARDRREQRQAERLRLRHIDDVDRAAIRRTRSRGAGAIRRGRRSASTLMPEGGEPATDLDDMGRAADRAGDRDTGGDIEDPHRGRRSVLASVAAVPPDSGAEGGGVPSFRSSAKNGPLRSRPKRMMSSCISPVSTRNARRIAGRRLTDCRERAAGRSRLAGVTLLPLSALSLSPSGPAVTLRPGGPGHCRSAPGRRRSRSAHPRRAGRDAAGEGDDLRPGCQDFDVVGLAEVVGVEIADLAAAQQATEPAPEGDDRPEGRALARIGVEVEDARPV